MHKHQHSSSRRSKETSSRTSPQNQIPPTSPCYAYRLRRDDDVTTAHDVLQRVSSLPRDIAPESLCERLGTRSEDLLTGLLHWQDCDSSQLENFPKVLPEDVPQFLRTRLLSHFPAARRDTENPISTATKLIMFLPVSQMGSALIEGFSATTGEHAFDPEQSSNISLHLGARADAPLSSDERDLIPEVISLIRPSHLTCSLSGDRLLKASTLKNIIHSSELSKSPSTGKRECTFILRSDLVLDATHGVFDFDEALQAASDRHFSIVYAADESSAYPPPSRSAQYKPPTARRNGVQISAEDALCRITGNASCTFVGTENIDKAREAEEGSTEQEIRYYLGERGDPSHPNSPTFMTYDEWRNGEGKQSWAMRAYAENL